MLRKCRVCGLTADTEEELELFSKQRTSKFGRKNLCLPCSRKSGRARMKVYRERNPEKIRERQREYYQKNREKINATRRVWSKNNPNYYSNLSKEKRREYKKRYNRKLKLQVLEILGDECECCGVSIYEFLTVAHINDDGYKERNKNTGSRGIYRKIIKLFKEDPEAVFKKYRILCFNCHFGGHFNGGVCPHKNNI